MRADVRTRELAVAPPAQQVVDNRRIDNSSTTTVHVHPPPGADAQEIADQVADEVDRVMRERDERRRDEIEAVFADPNRRVSKY